jgi:hypothetical protein
LIQSNQKSSQQKCFFARKAFTLQISQNHGLLNFALLRTLIAIASAKLLMPLQPHKATMF